jgi:two-component system response regulator MprA
MEEVFGGVLVALHATNTLPFCHIMLFFKEPLKMVAKKICYYSWLWYIMHMEGQMDEKILIIEDDKTLSRILEKALSQAGYQVETAQEGETGVIIAENHDPALVMLDWRLPGMSGLEVVQQLRSRCTMPILMLTANDALDDRVQGLDAGADDYMTKPFELDELLARVRALLRRTQAERTPVLIFADLSMNLQTREVHRTDRLISLTAKEFDLLELFLRHPRQVLTRDVIFDRVWRYDFGGTSNVLDVYVRYLRQKLEEQGEARLIQTVRGVGYILKEEE